MWSSRGVEWLTKSPFDVCTASGLEVQNSR